MQGIPSVAEREASIGAEEADVRIYGHLSLLSAHLSHFTLANNVGDGAPDVLNSHECHGGTM